MIPKIGGVKSTAVSYLLWILDGFGVLGLHRFYLGRWVTGLIWLLTGGLLSIGAIIDLFVIPPMIQVENLSRHMLSHAQGKKPQINADGHGWTERGGKRESGVRGQEFGDLKPQTSSLVSPQMNTDRTGKPDLRLCEGPGVFREGIKARRQVESGLAMRCAADGIWSASAKLPDSIGTARGCGHAPGG